MEQTKCLGCRCCQQLQMPRWNTINLDCGRRAACTSARINHPAFPHTTASTSPSSRRGWRGYLLPEEIRLVLHPVSPVQEKIPYHFAEQQMHQALHQRRYQRDRIFTRPFHFPSSSATTTKGCRRQARVYVSKYKDGLSL